jgi:K+-transporting ATPase ATPase C chain
MHNFLRPALRLFAVLTLLTGVVYPLAVTCAAQLVFSDAANGSLIVRDGKPLGSSLIGQPFADPKYFWSRPSATLPFANNSASSSGSNLGPTNKALNDSVKSRIDALRAVDPDNLSPVPVDLVTTSASGLDPHISIAAANYQIARVARVRGISVERVQKAVQSATQGRQLGFLGEPRVNVLYLNLLLDGRS